MSYEHITCAQSDPVIRYNITQNKLIFKYSHYISQRFQVFNSLWVIPFHCMKNPPVLNDVLLLCKRLDFQVKELGLVPNYRQDYAYKLRVKKLAALAFIPVSDLAATFEFLSTSSLMMSYDSLPTSKTRG